LKMGLCVSMLLSLRCLFCLTRQNIWNFSKVSRCLPLVSIFIMSNVSSVLPYECPELRICFVYPDVSLLYLIALICSLYLVLNERPV
jgi:hypothetical protein